MNLASLLTGGTTYMIPKYPRPDFRLYSQNLQDAWANVSAADIRMGSAAYGTYHATLRRWAAFYGVGFVPTVEAFVALSPSSDYHGNLRSLSEVMFAYVTDKRIGTISTFNSCGDRAMSYLSGEVSFLDTVEGRKITSFRDNILYLHNSKRATIDGHMIALCHAKDLTMKEANLLMRKGGGSLLNYEVYEKAVIALAKRLALPPCWVQAILWTYRKRSKGIMFDAQIDLLEGDTKFDRPLSPLDYPPYDTDPWKGWAKARALECTGGLTNASRGDIVSSLDNTVQRSLTMETPPHVNTQTWLQDTPEPDSNPDGVQGILGLLHDRARSQGSLGDRQA